VWVSVSRALCMEAPLSRAKLSVVVAASDWRAVGGVKCWWCSVGRCRGNIRVSVSQLSWSCVSSSCSTCVCRHDGVLPLPVAVLAALHVQSELVDVVLRRWTRPQRTRAGRLRAILDSWARKTVRRWGTYLRDSLMPAPRARARVCVCVAGTRYFWVLTFCASMSYRGILLLRPGGWTRSPEMPYLPHCLAMLGI